MEKASSSRTIFLKLVAIAAFLSFTLSMVMIWVHSPATGYEISIFTALPFSIWVLIFFSMICAIGLIVWAVSFGDRWIWIPGWLLLLLFNTAILALQFVRGYFLYAVSDPFAHIGTTAEIVTTGHFIDNYYPAVHILAAAISLLSGLSAKEGIEYLPLLFTLLFMVFTYYLTRSISRNSRCAILAAAAGTPLYFAYYHLTPYPHALAIFLLPLLFFVYFRSQNAPSRGATILLILLLILYDFFHPLIVMVLISSLVAVEGAKWLWRMRMPGSRSSGSANPVLISVCSFFLWFIYFTGSGIPAQHITQRVSQETVTTIKRAQELDPVFHLDFLHFIELTIKMYGHIIIILICAGLACGLAAHYFMKRERDGRDLFIFTAIFVASLLSYMVVANRTGLVTMGRLFSANAGIWATPVLAGVILTRLIDTGREHRKKYIAMGVTLLLVFSCIIGVLSSYRSPWIYQQSWQVTYMDIAGNGWFGDHSLEFGFEYEPMGFGGRYKEPNFPRHFGYTRDQFAGDSLFRDTYVVLTSRFIEATKDPALQYYMNVPWYLGRQGFDPPDLVKFENDPTVDLLYSNREFSFFIARSTGKGG